MLKYREGKIGKSIQRTDIHRVLINYVKSLLDLLIINLKYYLVDYYIKK